MTSCEDCRYCTECGVSFICLSEPRVTWPCPHLYLVCGDCLPGECDGCTADLERQITADRIRDALQAAFDNTAARDNRDNTDPDPWNPHNWHAFRHADHYGPGYHQAHKDKP